MSNNPHDESGDVVDVYIWEGASDIALRAERHLADYDAVIYLMDHTVDMPQRDISRPGVALVSVSVMNDGRFSGFGWLATQGIPVVWVAAEDRQQDPRFYAPEYSYTLPLAFTGAELRRLLFRLAGLSKAAAAPVQKPLPAIVAVSPAMIDLLAEARLYADSRSSVLLHGETGVGKERVARLLHEAASWSRGPFVAVNCGAVPEGLFEAHFFGHAKGAFTGAVGAHKGYFEQAHGGTLFLDEIGDLPLYQQVKLLRVLERNLVTRLGSTGEILVDFRLVAATNKDLRQLVAQGDFRADLYYRLAVIELRVPNLEERGPEEKAAIFSALFASQCEDCGTPPDWLLTRVSSRRYPGNVRELSNLVERVAIACRQTGQWDRTRIEQLIGKLHSAVEPADAAGMALTLSPAGQAERDRILAALDANRWRRQDTAAYLGISRKVLWEKMRKYRLEDPQAEADE